MWAHVLLAVFWYFNYQSIGARPITRNPENEIITLPRVFWPKGGPRSKDSHSPPPG
jgi:hypothetical protein